MPLDLTPVTSYILGGVLNLSSLENHRDSALQARADDALDYLANIMGRPTLFVQTPERYAILKKNFGTSAKATLDEQELQVTFARCSPAQYAGRRFTTKSESVYCLDETNSLTGRGDIDGFRVGYVAGLDQEYYRRAKNLLLQADNVGFRELIIHEGQEVIAGRHLALSLFKEVNLSFITSPIAQIEPPLIA